MRTATILIIVSAIWNLLSTPALAAGSIQEKPTAPSSLITTLPSVFTGSFSDENENKPDPSPSNEIITEDLGNGTIRFRLRTMFYRDGELGEISGIAAITGKDTARYSDNNTNCVVDFKFGPDYIILTQHNCEFANCPAAEGRYPKLSNKAEFNKHR